MVNNTIVNLEKDLIKTINESNLPISIISLILHKISIEVNGALESVLKQELEQQELEEAAKKQPENIEESKEK